MNLAFLPEPKQIKSTGGMFRIPESGIIGISGHSLYNAACGVLDLLPRHSISVASTGLPHTLTLEVDSGLRKNGYQLSVKPDGIRIKGASPSAVFYGVQTLSQLLRQCPAGKIPGMLINDWPDFEERGVYYDVCRGRVPKLGQIMEQMALLAHCKINHYQLYIEHTFAFRKHPVIGKDASPLTPDDILQLDNFAHDLGIELVPSLATFGHMASILKHPQYHHLAEDWGVGRFLSPEYGKLAEWKKKKAWSLSPANPEIYDFLDDLFSEFLPLFSSKRFNVCCDETFDLGMGQSFELCRKKGTGRLYLNHISKLAKLSRKYGKKIMFWGDIISHYPDLIKEIPRDLTVLHWGYNHKFDYSTCRDFKNAGLKFHCCPGTSSWNSLFPRIPEANSNIHDFAVAGRKYGATGLLNTDWGDGGHLNFMEYSWYGYLFGAEQAWNVNADRKTFPSRFARLFLGTSDAAFVRALNTLGDIAQTRITGNQELWHRIFFAAPADQVFSKGRWTTILAKNGKLLERTVNIDAQYGRRSAAGLRKIRKTFAETAIPDPHGIMPYWIFAVDTMIFAADKLAVIGPGGNDTPKNRASLQSRMRTLLGRFRKLWYARNRTSEISITVNLYNSAIRSLGTKSGS